MVIYMPRKKQAEKPIPVPVSAPIPIVEPLSVITGIIPREPLVFVPGEPPNVKPVVEPENVKEPETVMVEVLAGALSIEWPIDVQPYSGSKRFVRGNRLEMPIRRAKRLEGENAVRIV